MKNKPKLILSTFFCFIMICFLIPVSAHAQATPISTMEDFRNRSISVFQEFSVNYTVIGKGGSHLITLSSKGYSIDQLNGVFVGRQIAGFGEDQRAEIVPIVTNVWDQSYKNMLQIYEYESVGLSINYTNTDYFYQRTNITSFNQTWYNITPAVTEENPATFGVINPNTYTGNKFTTFLIPPQSIAENWGRKNGALINSVDNITTRIEGDVEFVQFLQMTLTEPLVTDNNLDDGFDLIPISAPFADWIIGLIKVFLVLAIAVVAIVATLLITDLFGITNVFGGGDVYQTVNQGSSQDNSVIWETPEINNTALFNEYVAFANLTGTEPTMEGFYEFSQQYFENLARTSPDPVFTQTNNWSGEVSQTAETGGFLSGFLGGIMPIITAIVIIIALIIGFVLIVRIVNMARKQ